MSSVYFLIGKVLGKYKILEHIGHGGMSEVYKGQQLQLHRPVAIKVLHPFLAEDEGFVVRFQREARIVATLRHPNIVQVFDFDYNAELDLYYMVMEYINGPTLKSRLEKESLSREYIAATIAAIADALDYAHERGMIHRDIKPANIMFLDNDQPVLTDFGIAKMLTLSGLTASGAMVGTPAYMAPEVGTGKSGTSYSDIYALGVVLYQAITGSLPFSSESPMGIVMQHINDPPPHPSMLIPTIPPALEAVILKALEKDPEARFSRAAEMASALRQSMNLPHTDAVLRPVPTDKTPITPLAIPVQEAREATPSLHTSAPSVRKGRYKGVEAEAQAEVAVSKSVDTDKVPKRKAPFKKLFWVWLVILGLGIAGGSFWLWTTGSIPPFTTGYSLTQVPSQTYDVSSNITNPTNTPAPTQTPLTALNLRPTAIQFPTLTTNSVPEPCFPRGRVDMVKISPNERVGPGSSIIAYISIRNTGDCAWQSGTQMQFVSGALMEAPEVFPLEALLPDHTIQIHVPLHAPQAFGTYTSVWQVQQPNAVALGNRVTINVIVDDMPTATPLPLPTAATLVVTPSPLSLMAPELSSWEDSADSHHWQGTVIFQASGGTGNYRYYFSAVREENLINNGRLSLSAPRCEPLELDIWVISGVEVLHWQGKTPYPEPSLCN